MNNIESQLDIVWQIYRQQFSHPDQTVNQWLGYAADARGKMLRPALLMMTGAVLAPINQKHHTAAAIIELVHTATLLHDDVIDAAQTRRHRPSFNKVFDDRTAIMAGDMILAKALVLASNLQDYQINSYLAGIIEKLCVGELTELANDNQAASQSHYIEVIKNKTASLFSCCCWLGAYLSGANLELCQQFSDFGDRLGIAFQINDDIDDLCRCETATGKTSGNDIATGILTLPFIYFLQDRPDQKNWLAQMLEKNDDESRQMILAQLQQTGSIRQAGELASDYARAAVDALPGDYDCQSLKEFANRIINK